MIIIIAIASVLLILGTQCNLLSKQQEIMYITLLLSQVSVLFATELQNNISRSILTVCAVVAMIVCVYQTFVILQARYLSYKESFTKH